MGPIGCPETSVKNYRYALRNNPEERYSREVTKLSSQSAADCDSIMQAVTDFAGGTSISSTGVDTRLAWRLFSVYEMHCSCKQLHKTSATYHAGICWTLYTRKSLSPALESQVLAV